MVSKSPLFVVVRQARASDLPELQALEARIFPPWLAFQRRDFLSQLRRFKPGFWVAINKGKIVGYVTAELWRPETRIEWGVRPGAKHNLRGKTLYISSMAVLPWYRGRRVGPNLLHSLFQMAAKRGCDPVLLVSRKNLKKSHKFYLGMGFEHSETLEGHFRRPGLPVDGLVMSGRVRQLIRTSAARRRRPSRGRPRPR